MLENVEVLCHSSIKISKEKTIYIDPFKIDKNYNDADLIFITHDHYDHYSEEDIDKVKKDNTIIIAPKGLYQKIIDYGFKENFIISVEPNESKVVSNIKFETIPAYNINKQFHPKANNWLGYIIEINGIRYYIAGDTDLTEENQKVKCDVAFVPVGGTYTMNYKEAAQLINKIVPKIAIPIHYGSIVGTTQDATNFIKLLNPNIKGIVLIK
jgi:L-ascorbate metabolism protein UlaG (beta-lactamase superfamily)